MCKGRYIRLFFMWVDKPLAYYQIADPEDVFFFEKLLTYRGYLRSIRL